MDTGASRHMTEARELFTSLMEMNSRIYVELDSEAKYVVRRQGTILFELEL